MSCTKVAIRLKFTDMSTEITKKRERSTAYPSINLEEAIALIAKLRESLGQGPHDRENAAKGIGYSGVSGASARKIAALTHFGLLTRSGNLYTVSKLADSIIYKKSDEDFQRAVIESASNPTLYSHLLDRFSDDKLPDLLPNILISDHGLSPKAAPEAAKAFGETMRFAKLIDENSYFSQFVETDRETSNTPETNAVSGFNIIVPNQLKNSPAVMQTQILQGSNWRITLETAEVLNKQQKQALREFEDSMDDYGQEYGKTEE